MENVFHMGYCEGHKVIYVLTTNWQGKEKFLDNYEDD
jgi:hypothetical protein